MINICIIATIVIYLVGMLLVGFVYSKSNEDSSDFYLGGRTMGPLVTAMSADTAAMALQAVWNGVTIQRAFTLSKSKGGADGSSATAYSLTVSAKAIKRDALGAVVEGIGEGVSLVRGGAGGKSGGRQSTQGQGADGPQADQGDVADGGHG